MREQIPAWYFDGEHLAALARQHAETFQQAMPYEHVVIDDFLPAEIAQRLVDEFPDPQDIEWDRGDQGDMRENIRNRYKLGHSNEEAFGPFTRHLILQFYSATFLDFLGQLSGIADFVIDPHYRGGGLHSTGCGGKLMVHADKSRHPNKKIDQVLNLIYFLNPDWQEDYGGHLEIWDEAFEHCAERILPALNRAVFFKSGTNTYHGHPQPLTCPPDRRRNSIAIYYYMIDRPRSEHFSGYKGFVDWVPTTVEERALPLEETRPQLFRFNKK